MQKQDLVANVIRMVKGWMFIHWLCIMHGPFGDIMLSHDLWLDVGCDFTYAIKVFLIVNVGCNCFIVTNWHFSFNVVFICFGNRSQTA